MKTHWTIVMVMALAGFGLLPLGRAEPVTLKDSTPGSATLDGKVQPGEYTGFSAGINRGYGDVFGAESKLYVDTSSDGHLHFGLVTGPGAFGNCAVIYIDSVEGGVSGTMTLTDTDDKLRAMISGTNEKGSADLTFAPDFRPDYALAFHAGFAGLWQIKEKTFHKFIRNVEFKSADPRHFELSLLLKDMGVQPGTSFKYLVSYGNPEDKAGFHRSDEFHGVKGATLSGNPGFEPVKLGEGEYNTFLAYKEATDQ
jgi:hypothetical protein